MSSFVVQERDMLDIATLIITQEVLRDTSRIPEMISFIKNGGEWSKEAISAHAEKSGHNNANMIYIAEFPDGALYIHDGHTRTMATLLAGRGFLYESEYVREPWKYEQYETINWDVNYVTPHDIRHEIRLGDFWQFKKEVLALKKMDHIMAEEYVWAHRNLYCRPRTMRSVMELCSVYQHIAA